MTSANLLDRINSYKFFRENKIIFSADVYPPANDAQKELLTDLRAVQGSCQLALQSAQEQYTFSAVSILSSTNTSPSIVTTAAVHPFATGDSVIINGHLVNTAINGSNVVTVLSPTTFSVPVAGNGVGVATGSAYHALMQAFEVFQARKSGKYNGRLDLMTQAQIDEQREAYGASSSADKVNRYYESFGESYLFGVQGIPAPSDIIVVLNFYRIALSFQEISANVNPILPAMFDRALYLGTLKNVLENLQLEELKPGLEDIYYKEALGLFDKEKARLRSVLAEARRPRPQGRTRLKW